MAMISMVMRPEYGIKRIYIIIKQLLPKIGRSVDQNPAAIVGFNND